MQPPTVEFDPERTFAMRVEGEAASLAFGLSHLSARPLFGEAGSGL